MTAYLLPEGRQSFTDASGRPLIGGKVYTYLAGTSTPQPTWADANQSALNPNPVILNGRGEATIFWNGVYKIALTDIDDVPIWTIDNVSALDFSTEALTAGLVQTVEDRAAMAALPVNLIRTVTIKGDDSLWEWRTGDFTSQVASDAFAGLYQPHDTIDVTDGCWCRKWDEVNGQPEWFGARGGDIAFDNQARLEAAHTLCPVLRLGATDYYIQDTVNFGHSNRTITGVVGSGRNIGVPAPDRMGQAGGTRIILTGPAVQGATVAQLGKVSSTGDNETQMRNSEISNIAFCRDLDGSYNVSPSIDSNPVNCVKGVIISFSSGCKFENLFSFDSPAGFHVFGVVYSFIRRCSAFRKTPSNIALNDFSVGALVGNYNINFGYIGANASVYIDDFTAYDLPGSTGDSNQKISIGMKVFGYFADTFIRWPEVGRVDLGLEIDGRDIGGSTVTLADGPYAHQDLQIERPIIDGAKIKGLQIRNVNDHATIGITDIYAAVANIDATNVDLFNIDAGARISLTGGQLLQGDTGFKADTVNCLTLEGVAIREAENPVVLNHVYASTIEPAVWNDTYSATSAISMTDCGRNGVRPIIAAKNAKITYGISMSSDCIFNNIDPSAIDPGGFVSISSANKVRFDGADARGSSAFTTAENKLSGVAN